MDPQVKNVLIQLSNLGEAKASAERDLREGRIDSTRYQQIRLANGEQIAQCHRTLAQMPDEVASAQAEVDSALARCREELATLDNDTKLGLLTPAQAAERREPLAARQISLEQVHQEEDPPAGQQVSQEDRDDPRLLQTGPETGLRQGYSFCEAFYRGSAAASRMGSLS